MVGMEISDSAPSKKRLSQIHISNRPLNTQVRKFNAPCSRLQENLVVHLTLYAQRSEGGLWRRVTLSVASCHSVKVCISHQVVSLRLY